MKVSKPVRTVIELLRPMKNKVVSLLLIPFILFAATLVILFMAISYLVGFLFYELIKNDLQKTLYGNEGFKRGQSVEQTMQSLDLDMQKSL